MDDLNAKISEVLADPGAMKQLTELASMFGSPSGEQAPEKPPEPALPSMDMGMLTQMMPLLSSVSAEDDTTRLLAAIRPFLGEERRRKLDEAGKLLRMMKFLPLLRNFKLLDI